MSTIKKTPIELSTIVEEANLILSVAYLEPFTEEIIVKSVNADVPVPHFEKKGCIFRVKAILKNSQQINVPETIRVPNEDWRRSLNRHKEKYADGSSKSYDVKEYETEVKSIKKADILFLHHFQGTFELEVKDSFESNKALDKITILISAA
jgi:hypothetical protein